MELCILDVGFDVPVIRFRGTIIVTFLINPAQYSN
jgi:hypothetical protein